MTARDRNRERFPDAAEWLDVLRANGFPHASVQWARNAGGEEIGKRDPGPWAEYRPQGVREVAA